MSLGEETAEYLEQCEDLMGSLRTLRAPHAINEFQNRREVLQELLNRADEESEWEVRARTGIVLGRLEFHLGPWSSAHSLLRGAFGAASHADVDQTVLASAAVWLARLDMALGYRQHSNMSAHLGLAQARAVGDRVTEAEALVQLFVVEMRFGFREAANARLEEARKLIEPHDYMHRAAVLSGLAWIQVEERKLNEAFTLEQAALECRISADDAAGEALSRRQIAKLYAADGQFDNAQEWFQTAYSLARRIVYPYGVAVTLESRATAYEEDGKIAEAVEACLRSEFIFSALGSRASRPHEALLRIAGISKGEGTPGSSTARDTGWHNIL